MKNERFQQILICVAFSLFALASIEPKKKKPTPQGGNGGENASQASDSETLISEKANDRPTDGNGPESRKAMIAESGPEQKPTPHGFVNPDSRISESQAGNTQREERASRMKAELDKVERRARELAQQIGREEYERMLAAVEREFADFGRMLDAELTSRERETEKKVAMMNKLVFDLEKHIKEAGDKDKLASKLLDEARLELKTVDATITDERARYQNALDTINRLTNFKRTPVQEGSQAYYRCVEASKVIQEIEQNAPALKEKKAELEAIIRQAEGAR